MADAAPTIFVQHVTKAYSDGRRKALDDVSFAVKAREFVAIVGPSGSGKTTLLRLINRLAEPSEGRVEVEGKDVTRADPIALRRRIGYVFQGIGLFPHMTVAENIGITPQLIGWDRTRIAARVAELLALVRLDAAAYAERLPHELSGGERQRVGVARALAADPPVLLMDEPFGAVDPIVRAGLQAELLGILRRLAKTVIFVTHDIDEAIRMGDLIAIMKDGRLVQCAPPERLLAAPADAFVADFVGADRALKRLALSTAADAAAPGEAPAGAPTVAPTTSLREALSVMLAAGTDAAWVAGAGIVTLAAIRRAAHPSPPAQP
jgi:osmoprotectant transport system ATP-binding protein